ncbi:MAG TPA: DUF4239 domain-containing protein [Candidatus Binataceae bacterium]|nr:DUF4239 domain-containing protein [Candidatus Binataceae bacterium]
MDFLLYCSTLAQVFYVVCIFGGASVGGLYLVRRLVSLDRLRENHEIGGLTFGVVGAFYGLLLAFVIVAAWERFDNAGQQTHQEAVALESLYKIGTAFSEPTRKQVMQTTWNYTTRVLQVEWPEMSRNDYHPQVVGAHLMWKAVLSCQPSNNREQVLLDKALEELDQISGARSLRIAYYRESLPSVMWLVIYLGCAITVGFSYFFGHRAFSSQAVMCATLAILLGISILAVIELSHPYQGNVTVSDEPFRYALSRMSEINLYQNPPHR